MFLRQGGAVFGGENLVWQAMERVLGDGMVLLGAQDEPDGRILVGQRPVFTRVVQVQMHLPGVGVREAAELQIDVDQALGRPWAHDYSAAPVGQQDRLMLENLTIVLGTSGVAELAVATAVPAGGALAVDRQAFARLVTQRITDHPRIHLRREEAKSILQGTPTVIATGPLTSDTLALEIAALTGQEHLYFYDAMAPIVSYESIDLSQAFRGSRYGRDSERSVRARAPTEGVGESSADFYPSAQEPTGGGDYINSDCLG